METPLLIGIVVALTEIVKRLQVIPKEYLPFVSIGVAILIVNISLGFTADHVIDGLLVGLLAAGAWDAGKLGVVKTREKLTRKKK